MAVLGLVSGMSSSSLFCLAEVAGERVCGPAGVGMAVYPREALVLAVVFERVESGTACMLLVVGRSAFGIFAWGFRWVFGGSPGASECAFGSLSWVPGSRLSVWPRVAPCSMDPLLAALAVIFWGPISGIRVRAWMPWVVSWLLMRVICEGIWGWLAYCGGAVSGFARLGMMAGVEVFWA